MEKLLLIIVAGALAATVLVLAGVYAQDYVSLSPGSISGAQRSAAVNIALSDTYVQQYISAADNYTIGSVMPLPGDFYSYSGNTTRIIVPLTVRNQYFNNLLMVTIDMDESRTVTIFETPAGSPYDLQGLKAVHTVISDPAIGDLINNSGYSVESGGQTTYHKNIPIVRNPVPHENSDYGLLNDSTPYEDVSIQVGEMAPVFTTVTATVDMGSGRVVMAKYQDAEMMHPPRYTVTIKPGAMFYKQYSGFANHSFADYPYKGNSEGLSTIDDVPGAAIPQPVFVDGTNFLNLRNGTYYQLMSITINRTDKGWQAFVPKGTDFYLVLRNDDAVSNSAISLSPNAIFI